MFPDQSAGLAVIGRMGVVVVCEYEWLWACCVRDLARVVIFGHTLSVTGRLAQMVERPLRMREVGGSIPPMSNLLLLTRASWLRRSEPGRGGSREAGLFGPQSVFFLRSNAIRRILLLSTSQSSLAPSTPIGAFPGDCEEGCVSCCARTRAATRSWLDRPDRSNFAFFTCLLVGTSCALPL